MTKILQENPNLPARIEPLAYCVEDAAKALGIGRTQTFYLIRDGQLKAVKIGRRTLVPVKEIEAFLERLAGVDLPKAG